MPRRRRNKGNKKAAVSGGDDRLSALPEDVILLLLSFLPSRQAVQMSVLGPHWRTLWKSLPSLRIEKGADTSKSAKFVNSLLRHRDRTPLLECEILSNPGWQMDEDEFDTDELLRYALSCKVRVLRLKISSGPHLRLSTGSLISEHLTRITLYRVEFVDFSLDVSSCQSLKELEMNRCEINTQNIGTDFPKSLRLLRIRNSGFLPEQDRSFISAPGLVTLELADCNDWTPWLKSLPSLVTAFIRIGFKCSCAGCDEPRVKCRDLDDGVLLEGLSGVTNLELISHHFMVFRKEIKCYPTFSKLKTLLLGDWCMASNFSGLLYFLQHSPILERFTLQLGISSKKTKMREVYKPRKQFLVSKHLKSFEITYFKKDGRVHQILNFLVYHGILPELINIERKPYVDCFSFERKQ
ncbi:hypothetical protein QYE76_007188 [Lolium multiflorum]|uniref:F-box domain-containing protein n=1 Tax=Lolium multiflorum TaxID=4521 RepID=A0AAD8RX67_LOLMU|nr:hypothetical protein QYE76_007188 [Lolium multiflorum]